jgi:uncharacterized membrane protein
MRGFYGFGGGGIWWILGLVCLAVLAILVVWLIVANARGTHQAPPQQPWQGSQQPGAPVPPPRMTPNEILRERFARGEMTAEEFEKARTLLGPDPKG